VCLRALADRGEVDDAVKLADAVRHADVPAHLVAAATQYAVECRGDGGAAVLVRQLESDEPELVNMAIRLARQAEGERITRALADKLAGLAPDRQVLLIEALGDRGDSAALAAVAKAAEAEDVAVRVAALKAMAQIGDGSVVPALLVAASAPEGEVAEAAQIALATLPGDDVDAAVLGALTAADTTTRRVAIEAAGQRNLAAANPTLLEAVNDADGAIRAAAIAALGQTTGADGLTALVGVLLARQGDEVGLAEAAVGATISRVPDQDACANALTAALGEAAMAPKCALVRLLAAAPTAKALDALRVALSDPEADVQNTAFGVLCGWPTPAAAPDLLAIAKADANADRAKAALYGYMRLVGSPELSADQKMAMCNEAAALCKTDEDNDHLLTALATVAKLDALNMAMALLDTAALTNKVSWTAVNVGELLEQSHPAEVAAAMERVLNAMNNPGMERRVRSCMERAQKAAGK
jgi:HEAT repeat protein